MDSDATCSRFAPKDSIAHVMVEDVPNSQNSLNGEYDYNPFISQTQHSSQAGHLVPQASVESEPLTENIAESTSVEKKCGRSSKDATLNLQPTRESQRSKKCPKALSYDSFQNSARRQWSEEDKNAFLAGCMEVGIEDIKGLNKFLPHKTEADIKNQIEMWKELAARNVERQLSMDENKLNVSAESISNIDDWINHFKEDASSSNSSSFVMSNFFSIIAEYGVLPSPKECGGVDFRAMYRYIHCMMNGLPAYGLNARTSKVLLKCIDSAQEIINDPKMIESLKEHLLFPPTKPAKWCKKFGKTYSRKSKKRSSKPIDQILNNPTMNPLGLQKNAVVRESIEASESSDEEAA